MTATTDAFETFRARLELSETERQATIRRHNEVRECIRAKFDIDRDFLTGSYARHTKTKPLKDVDIFFVLSEREAGRRAKPPGEVLEAFRSCLAERYGKDAVELGRRCVTVEFEKRNPTADQEGKVLSIDAVPAFELDDCYEIPDRELGRWIKSDPDVHKTESTAKNAECDGRWVPLVKMLKRWNRSAGKPIAPSFLIEVMAQDLVRAPCGDYPTEVRSFFAAAQEGVWRDWPDPAGFGPPVSDQMTRDKRGAAAKLLQEAELQAMHAMRLISAAAREIAP
ncbi:nucleotidyltransferase [Leptolyngbya sp. 15MV]|nr:nucleotidyltransferase [Leptolyngbya sp. 15MV]